MKVVTSQQIVELEQQMSKEYSIKAKDLMENAGYGVAKWIEQFVEKRRISKNILIISGRGNNGGDSFVAARYLIDSGFDIELILLSKEADIKGASKVNYTKLKKKKKSVNL